MKRFGKLVVWLSMALIGASQADLAARGEESKVKVLGESPAYEQVGKLAVMHVGRLKPLDTLAREEVKHVFGRETITLHDASNNVVETWGPVGAFLDWTVRPEYWDDQPFVLVDYLPLRRVILADSTHSRLKDVAAHESTSADDRAALTRLVESSELTSAAITAYLKNSKLAEADHKTVAELASRLGEEHKWLAPRELEDAKITHNGQPTAFMEWVAALDEQKQKFDANPNSAERLTEIEKRAIDAGRRLMTYKGYSGEEMRSAGLVRVMPRPFSFKALGYLTQVIKKARESNNLRDLSPIEFDTLKAIDTYWNDIPRDQRVEPGKDAKLDEKFADWLRDNSVWVPLKVLIKAKPAELAQAGYAEAEVNAFLENYRALEQAEDHYPGQVSREAADGMLASSRKLGESVNPSKYPTVAMIERETHFNAANPFWKAPIAYGTAVVLLMVSLGFTAGRKSFTGLLGQGFSPMGMLALATGIGLEIYGFALRILISGWAPVTNMYETVIWVALVAAVLSFIFELIFRRTYSALAGSAVALLGTITAVNVPLLDPSIKSLQPVLRSNYWLTIHVLTEVSSYAAFGVAWALGLIAMAFYLTATYRRSPRFGELALPLVPGLPMLTVGGLGVAASYGAFGSQWATGDLLFYLFAMMGGIGGMLTLGSVLAMAGEMVNRKRFREDDYQEDLDADPDHESALSHEAPEPNDGSAAARARAAAAPARLDARGRAMQETALTLKPLSNFIYRAMQVGVLLIAAGTILGGVWADASWGRFWGWDPKEVWALITLLVYLVPLHGRFAGWVNTFGLAVSSVVCFLSVVMAWYGVNFVLGVGLHSYGFTEGGSQGLMSMIIAAVMSIPLGAFWRRHLGYRQV